jgi:hypothetical protein
MVLLQVVIAVLLEEVDKARSEPATSSRRLEQRGALQPLLRDLAAGFEGRDDLRRRLRAVFGAVCAAAAADGDSDDSGAGRGELDRVGLQLGLAGLGHVPPIWFGEREWAELVEGRGLCDGRGRMRQEQFETMLMDALRSYQVAWQGASCRK